MSDDADDSEVSYQPSIFQVLMRKLMYIFGAAMLIWMLVIKNFPEMAVTHNGVAVNPRSTPAKAETATPAKPAAQPLTTAPVAAAAPASAPAVASTGASEEVVQLRQRIDELETRMKQYEGKPAATGDAPQGLSDADKQRMAQLEEQLSTQKGALASVKEEMTSQVTGSREHTQQLEEQVKKQQDIITALKEQIEEVKAHGSQKLTTMTAFGFLREAILRGEPFTQQLKQLASQIDDPKVKSFLVQFVPYADKGILTLPALQGEFTASIPAALSPAASKNNSLSQNIRSLIRIRKVGEQQQGSDDESIIARAEAKLSRDEVGASLKEMSALSPPAADTFAPWVKHAEAFVLVRNHLDTLQVAIVQDKAAAMLPELQASPAVTLTVLPAKETPAAPPAPEVKKDPAPEPSPATPDSE